MFARKKKTSKKGKEGVRKRISCGWGSNPHNPRKSAGMEKTLPGKTPIGGNGSQGRDIKRTWEKGGIRAKKAARWDHGGGLKQIIKRPRTLT